MKLLIVCLSVFLLSSCKEDFPGIMPQERCVVVLEEVKIEDVILYEGRCRCVLYEWELYRIGPVGESKNYELAKCNKLIGFTPDTYVEIHTWWESVRLWLKRQMKK